MNRSSARCRLILVHLLLFFAVFSGSILSAADERPNILFIMVDDLGKEWISSYGAEGIETPNIDHLAETGIRFKNAYSMPQCTPTRLTLLTGQYPFEHGWTNHYDVPRWGSGVHFDPDRNASVARVLRQAGYATAIAGKWQIDDFRVEPNALHEAGFDAWSVWTGGEGGNLKKSGPRYWNPYIHQGTRGNTASKTRDRFGPDIFTDFLIDFMKGHSDQPFFLYYPMVLTHHPIVSTPAEPDVNGKTKKFKAMVRYTDRLVGRLARALEKEGEREDTIIIFTADNGSPGDVTGRRNGRKINGQKGQMSEPGVAMPFIVSGPSMVPEGRVTDALTDFTDLLPTFADLAGTAPNDRWNVHGRSIAPFLLGEAEDTPRDWIYAQGGGFAEFKNNRTVPAQPFDDRVIRTKRWKLWVSEQRKPVRLYNVKKDPDESNNLIDSDDPAAKRAKKSLWKVIKKMPKTDHAPRYEPNPAQPWDKYDYAGPDEAPDRRFR
jgi:arylsulfatase A-like enzyme